MGFRGVKNPTNWDGIYQTRLVDFTLASKPVLAKNVLAILPPMGRSEMVALLTQEDVPVCANI